jgi:hypothetical protein
LDRIVMDAVSRAAKVSGVSAETAKVSRVASASVVAKGMAGKVMNARSVNVADRMARVVTDAKPKAKAAVSRVQRGRAVMVVSQKAKGAVSRPARVRI